MKNIFRGLIAVASLSFLLAGCAEEDKNATPSPISDPNCKHVYIDTSSSTSVQVDPYTADASSYKTKVTFKRRITEGALTVPVKVVDAKGIFKSLGSSINVEFADGASATTYEFDFTDATPGDVDYFELLIEDPAMIDPYTVYSNGSNGIFVNVSITKWEAYTGDIIIQDIKGMHAVLPEFFKNDTTAWYVKGKKEVGVPRLTGGEIYRISDIFKTDNPGSTMTPDANNIYSCFPYNTATSQMDGGEKIFILKVPGNNGIVFNKELRTNIDLGHGEVEFGSTYSLAAGNPRGKKVANHIEFPARTLYFKNLIGTGNKLTSLNAENSKTRLFFDLDTYKTIRKQDIANQPKPEDPDDSGEDPGETPEE